MKHRPILAALVITQMLGACGRADSDPASGGMTVGETEALERAADRLDARAQSPAAAESQALENDVRARLDDEMRKKNAN